MAGLRSSFLKGSCRHCYRSISVLALGLFCVVASPPDSLAALDMPCPSYIRISFGEQEHQKDGSVTQRFYILNHGFRPDCFTIPELKAFYRLGNQPPPGQGFYVAQVSHKGRDSFIEICSNTNARLELYVTAKYGDRQFLAQAIHYLFGKGPADVPKKLKSVQAFSLGLPRLHLEPSPRDYFMQTGMTYKFKYIAKGGISLSAATVDKPNLLTGIPITSDGVFDYCPPHDSGLRRTGRSAGKETIILVEESVEETDYITTHTLLLHRSLSAHLSLLPGLGLLGITSGLIALIVICRRSRNYPWLTNYD